MKEKKSRATAHNITETNVPADDPTVTRATSYAADYDRMVRRAYKPGREPGGLRRWEETWAARKLLAEGREARERERRVAEIYEECKAAHERLLAFLDEREVTDDE